MPSALRMHSLQHDTDRNGELADCPETRSLQRWKRVKLASLASTVGKRPNHLVHEPILPLRH
ncbi:MAG: hypothetical protein QM758_15410 [Armatimonas sp.]